MIALLVVKFTRTVCSVRLHFIPVHVFSNFDPTRCFVLFTSCPTWSEEKTGVCMLGATVWFIMTTYHQPGVATSTATSVIFSTPTTTSTPNSTHSSTPSPTRGAQVGGLRLLVPYSLYRSRKT